MHETRPAGSTHEATHKNPNKKHRTRAAAAPLNQIHCFGKAVRGRREKQGEKKVSGMTEEFRNKQLVLDDGRRCEDSSSRCRMNSLEKDARTHSGVHGDVQHITQYILCRFVCKVTGAFAPPWM